MNTHRNALATGSMLLWYQIERVLGQGAFGITYLAQDSNLHRPVAIKEYLPSQLSFREGDGSVLAISDDLADEYDVGLRRFVTEARTLAKFEHPAIVRVHNIFEANRTAYMVMQYEQGEDLSQILKRHRTLEESEILQVLHPLLAGLEVIHAQGFVHRDIKPGNIFIRHDGTPLLLDFGSAREAIGGAARTLTNFVSPGYAPIEQYASKSDGQGPWSDIYGLGATVYRAMTGRPPIDAVERSNALAQETSDSYQTGAQNAQRHYSATLLAAVDHALSFRAQDRPQSIAAWRAELPPSPPATATQSRLFAAIVPAPPLPDPEVSAPTLMLTLPGTEFPPVEAAASTLLADEADAVAGPPGPQQRGTGTVDRDAMTTEKREGTVREASLPSERGLRATQSRRIFVVFAIAALIVAVWLIQNAREREAQTVTTAVESALPVPAPDVSERQPEPVVSPAAQVPAIPDAEQRNSERIADLLYRASLDLDASRLMLPAGQNAYEKYREILSLEPGHEAAIRGIEALSDRYVGLVYRDLEAGRLARAESYLRKAESLAPGRYAISEARQALAAERHARATARTPAQTGTAPVKKAAPSRMDSFRERFDAFVREQKAAQRAHPESRGDQLRERLGGGQ